MPASLFRLRQNDAGSGTARVMVHAAIEQHGGTPFPISRAMYLSAGGWKVYDVAISGVSLVTSPRSGFGSSIRQDRMHSPIEPPGNRNAGALDG
jgi:phospholipid transport system substrate-binding protein